LPWAFASSQYTPHNVAVGDHANWFQVLLRVDYSNPDRSPVAITAETQPQLQPALLRLSAMISRYFTQPLCVVTIQPAAFSRQRD
jgi:hypothetical protein